MDIAREIEKVVADRSKSFDSVFSRNKMLRRKINRRKGKRKEESHEEGSESCELESENSVLQ